MQSLGNQSQVSLLSWWSDSNPGLNGPTINLHTITKPLVRLMYHRQALEYIRVNNERSLTEAMFDIFSSYLECKYVADRTKLAVLAHLYRRAHWSTKEAQSIVDSSVFSAIPQLVESSNADIRGASIGLITMLADCDSVVAPIDTLNLIAEKMGLLLRDESAIAVESATDWLVRIALWDTALTTGSRHTCDINMIRVCLAALFRSRGLLPSGASPLPLAFAWRPLSALAECA
ncbi:hypothetical protein FB45DRAFT_914604 [Roridomyces roridus]|uniref:Uncharacterized protein n=1 Tax=Roridomyces roridus TaxID=1738132 RepID=A0AAD7BXL0_9AGAR|nr:hypothetical protein FB45DRAFT_914604 [Roridomyces roridus]